MDYKQYNSISKDAQIKILANKAKEIIMAKQLEVAYLELVLPSPPPHQVLAVIQGRHLFHTFWNTENTFTSLPIVEKSVEYNERNNTVEIDVTT